MSTSVFIRRAVALVAAIALAGLVGVAPTRIAHAATTISVNTAADLPSCNAPGTPNFSLRCAINYENGIGGGDTIDFEISASAVTLHLRSQLPTLTASNVTIDGYDTSTEGSTRNTNSLAAGDNAVINVTVDGDSLAGNDGFIVYGSNDTIE